MRGQIATGAERVDGFEAGRSWRLGATAVALAAATFLAVIALAGSSAPLRQDAAGTPCPEASPQIAFPTPEGTPAIEVDDASCFVLAGGLGTPVAAGDLTVTIEADDLQAGPRALTVVILDADRAPVTGATVTLRTWSLEMDHGVSIDETVETEPGSYFTERVSLGMGGDWLAEITIERPEFDPVVLYFVLTLEGPSH